MKNTMKIRAIIFDFMGVLAFKKENYQPDAIVDGVDAIVGNLTNDFDFKKEAQEKFNLTDKEFEKILIKIVDKYEQNSDLWKLLPEIKDKFKLRALIMNNGTTLTLPYFNKKFNFGYFNEFICSAEVGIKKPDPEIFKLCARRLGVDVKECLFMDDQLANVESAKKLGMQTIWWSDRQKGMADLLVFLNIEQK
ncbi:MAG: HAD-IA family hydrolase [Candidatus Buchananbacteria bacterium]